MSCAAMFKKFLYFEKNSDMKKVFQVLFAALLLCSISMAAHAETTGKKPTKLLKKFAARVESHDVKGILTLLDGSYKQVQLIGTNKNDTTKFISELFCGYSTVDNKTFMCVKLSDIKKCSFMKLGKFDSDTKSPAYASVNYRIDTYDGQKIKINLVVLRITTSTGVLFRLAGAVG
ncbi:MAG: hypothetical protein A2W93_04090 [Bacteroidetes bacterium GWF2_43_63]|nr:MAG: hypothetical protein A2W94_06125 [Bacteroidetes bacterium GWE2_42_42]OFY54362.1 MAG: hypothetical protein A2W93_04090 [Bacteroidetes bacterium GWF2_43_63]HBG69248.1 hypothetical protein [Bacteroidales bacterium]HCB61196.1 hypothetical protein [Bacteroidales bacterium]HCY24116.1 hypothetical protein [Bacteroidales bacterium]